MLWHGQAVWVEVDRFESFLYDILLMEPKQVGPTQ